MTKKKTEKKTENKGNLITIKGDATHPQRLTPNEVAVIPHVCNNIKAWGAGFVIALSKRFFPTPRVTYEKHMDSIPVVDARLGRNSYADYHEEDGDYLVCNMVAQNNIISEDNSRPLKYGALVRCMYDVVKKIEECKCSDLMFSDTARKYVIHCPKFGAGLAGGNWDFILELINDIWLENEIDVVVYEFGE